MFSKIENSKDPNSTLSASKWTFLANTFVSNKPKANNPEKKTPINDWECLVLNLDKKEINQATPVLNKTAKKTKLKDDNDWTNKYTKTKTGKTEWLIASTNKLCRRSKNQTAENRLFTTTRKKTKNNL